MTSSEMKNKITIGTRGSALALKQTKMVKAEMEELWPELKIELEIIKTTGDRFQDRPLPEVGGKGLFTKELEEAMLDGRTDMAVHSMKDLPTELPPGLILATITEREEPWDALVTSQNPGRKIEELPENARVGTSSLRRQAQLLNLRPDFQILPLRGNLDTRLRKLNDEKMDGIVVALAGLKRMGWEDRVTQVLPPEICLPSVGQGALGIEIRGNDSELFDLLQKLDHPATRSAIIAERELLHVLQGGCQVPVGGYGSLSEDLLILEGMVASLDGNELIRHCMEGPSADPQGLGRALAQKLLEMGADRILQELLKGRE